jgi:hypothetical protein
VPNKVTNLRNAADTFKPYAPGQIIGDTTPTLPDPPPPPSRKKRWGAFASILVAAITVVAMSYMSPLAGNLVGQIAANALGTQKGFNFKSMAAAAVTAGVGGVIGAPVRALGDVGSAMANAALTNFAAQAVNTALGLQDEFAWSGVATAAIGAGFAEGSGCRLPHE